MNALLDLWKYDDRAQPGEGVALPTWFELHQQGIEIAIVVLVAVIMLIVVWRLLYH